MGKLYKVELSDIAIVDGKLVNCVVTDNFSSQNDTTKESRTLESATFTLDGLDIDTAIKFLWDALKVKSQARTWKNLSDADFNALDGGVHSILDFIPKAERRGNKGAIINATILEAEKRFFNKSLAKAVEKLGAEATLDEHKAFATEHYNEHYKEVIDDMIKEANKPKDK